MCFLQSKKKSRQHASFLANMHILKNFSTKNRIHSQPRKQARMEFIWKQQEAAKEIEVFQIELIPGKYYEHAEATRKSGRWPSQQCFAKSTTYVGKFLYFVRWGYGDGSGRADYFDLDGKQVRIEYSYAGDTCFREVEEIVAATAGTFMESKKICNDVC